MTQKKISLAVVLFLIMWILGCSRSNYDWPRWRGSNADGISTETGWNPRALDGNLHILWEIHVGTGFSPVTIKDGYLYTMGNTLGVSGGDSTYKDVVYCLNAETGERIWQFSYPCPEGGWPGPRISPTIDGAVVYTLSRAGHLYCFNAKNGEVIWNRNIVADSLALEPDWGFTGSPVVHGDMLILNAGKAGLAIHKKTGQVIWKSELANCGFATPVVYGSASNKRVAIFSRLDLFAVDAKTGHIFWSFPWKTPHEENIADPIISGHHMFISSGYKRGCTLFDISEEQPRQIYEHKDMCNHMTNCILRDGYLYGMHGNAMQECSLCCMDLMSGEIVWKEPFDFGSMICVDDKLILLTEKGMLHIGEATPQGYQEISSTHVLTLQDIPNAPWNKRNTSWTPPVMVGGRIYVRDNYGVLKCIDVST